VVKQGSIIYALMTLVGVRFVIKETFQLSGRSLSYEVQNHVSLK
jgi:hypothetical protein